MYISETKNNDRTKKAFPIKWARNALQNSQNRMHVFGSDTNHNQFTTWDLATRIMAGKTSHDQPRPDHSDGEFPTHFPMRSAHLWTPTQALAVQTAADLIPNTADLLAGETDFAKNTSNNRRLWPVRDVVWKWFERGEQMESTGDSNAPALVSLPTLSFLKLTLNTKTTWSGHRFD